MQYVKLVSDGTWFVKGSEVWHMDDFKRHTVEEWNRWKKSGVILCNGLRQCEDPCEQQRIGDVYLDQEMCVTDEFDVSFVDGYAPYS